MTPGLGRLTDREIERFLQEAQLWPLSAWHEADIITALRRLLARRRREAKQKARRR